MKTLGEYVTRFPCASSRTRRARASSSSSARSATSSPRMPRNPIGPKPKFGRSATVTCAQRPNFARGTGSVRAVEVAGGVGVGDPHDLVGVDLGCRGGLVAGGDAGECVALLLPVHG